MEPDGSVLVSAGIAWADGSKRGGAAADAANAVGAIPTIEEISRVLHDSDQRVLELTKLERDIEDYFVELMGAELTDANDAARAGNTVRATASQRNTKEA